MAAEICDRRLRVRRWHVLEDFNRDDQIVGLAQFVRDGSGAAEWLYRGVNLLDRIGREIDALGLDAAVSQPFDQKAEGTPGVQDAPRRNVDGNAFRDSIEYAKPLFVADVRLSAAVFEIESVEGKGMVGQFNQ